MDVMQMVTAVAAALFGAGGSWATLQHRVKRAEQDIKDIRDDADNTKVDFKNDIVRMDGKLDRIMGMLFELKK